MHHRTNRQLAAAARSARPRFETVRPAVEPLEGRRLMSVAAEPVAEATGSIGGFVFQDTNRDGLRSRDEAPRAAVPYLDLNGNAAYDNGEPGGQATSSFRFADLPAGRYTLRFGPAAGTVLPPTTTPAGEPKYDIDLAAGQNVTDRNLGFDVPTAIYGTVFEDLDRDGTRDANERGVAEGLYLDVNRDRVYQSTTDLTINPNSTTGYYEVVGLAPGTYTLWRRTTAAGLVNEQTTPTTPLWEGVATFTLGAGESKEMPSLGINRSFRGRLQVPVYADWDLDGQLGEGDTVHTGPALDSRVYLDLNNNGRRETGEPDGPYNMNTGRHEFQSLAAGTYLMRVISVDQRLSQVTSPNSGGSILVTMPATTGTAVAPPVMLHTPTPYRIVGTLWDDANANQVRDPGEAPLAGRTVWLDQDGDRRVGFHERRTVTAADGGYAFANTPASGSSYTVRQLLPNGWVQTTPAASPVFIPINATPRDVRRDFGSDRIYGRAADQSADEAAAQAFDLGTYTRVVDPVAITVDWGDGSPAEPVVVPAGSLQVPLGALPHTYADDGDYTVTVTVARQADGAVLDAGTFAVAVANRPPVAVLAGPTTVNERTPATFTFAAADPSPADRITRWVIDWGDGTPPEEFAGDVTSAVHAFPVGGGTRTVTATAFDEDGGAGPATLAVRVRTPAEAVADVRLAVDALSAAGRLTAAQHAGLAKKLDAARAAIVSGNSGKAVGQLSAFLDKVGGLVTDGVLTDDEAGPLVADATAIVDLL